MSLARIGGDAAETAVISLSILKSIAKLYGAEQAIHHMPIETGWDTVMDLYMTAISLCADKIHEKYFENHATVFTRIENDDMTEYFKMAYKYGELKGLSEEKNSFLNNVNTMICHTLGDISHYTFDFFLKSSKRRKPQLFLICYQEYYPNAEVVYQLYEFLGFFKKAIPLLDAELKSIEKANKPTKTRIKPKRRKAA